MSSNCEVPSESQPPQGRSLRPPDRSTEGHTPRKATYAPSAAYEYPMAVIRLFVPLQTYYGQRLWVDPLLH